MTKTKSVICVCVIVDDMQNELELTMSFFASWRDSRLFPRPDNSILETSTSFARRQNWTTLDRNFLEKLWKPDLVIYFVKQIHKHELLTPFEGVGN